MDNGKEPLGREAEPKGSVPSVARSTARKAARIVLGIVLMALGLAALFTPLTPGSWLILVGLEFLGLRLLLRDRFCSWARARPGSRLRRTACRVLSFHAIGALERRWRGRKGSKSEAPPERPRDGPRQCR